MHGSLSVLRHIFTMLVQDVLLPGLVRVGTVLRLGLRLGLFIEVGKITIVRIGSRLSVGVLSLER
jgi:hypothetical protein